jgi:beta-glucosidase-like glycosyl hydrolase
VTFPADGTHYPQYDPNCTNTAINGNCPLYPGVAQAGFISGTHNYRQIDFVTNGIFQGYRWYDKNNVTPLFPFGHGLSYTQFDYSNLSVQASGDGFDVNFRVRNSGSILGSEVPQVYLGAPANPVVPMAEQALVAFDRILLAPGQSQQVTIHIGQRQLSFYSVDAHDWVKAVGTRPVYVGSSSRDIRLTGSLYVPNLSIDELIDEMTLDEKLGMLHGVGFFNPIPARCLSSAGYVNGVARLNIPGLCMSDGPAGVRVSQPATALPAPMGLASTFSPDLAYSYGQVIGQEGRAYGQDVLLSPMVNNVRVPYAGRNFETLGEDPFLAGRIVGSEVEALQDAGLIATIKHYAENNQENNRQGVNVNVDEKTLHEIELAGFEAAINAGAGAVMCAYNKVNGTYSCENSVLLNDILRTQWGFTGLVMTDWFASHPSGVNALVSGLDIEMPGEVAFGAQLKQAVISGTIPLSAVDTAVHRILTSMDQVGLLDGSVGPRPSIDAIKDADADVARKVAEQGAVLLRNQNHTLPLDATDQQALVVVRRRRPRSSAARQCARHPLQQSECPGRAHPNDRGQRHDLCDRHRSDGASYSSTVLSFTTYSTFTEINFVGANALPSTTGTYT